MSFYEQTSPHSNDFVLRICSLKQLRDCQNMYSHNLLMLTLSPRGQFNALGRFMEFTFRYE